MELIKEVVDYGIMLILGLMGFIAIMYTIERVMFLNKVKSRIHEYSNQDEFDNALTNNLTTLYIIYSNAPYVGLLGTVVGIMITFYDMGRSASIDSSQIMTGLSLALYATALGLVVAIPTLIAYNALNRKIAVLSSLYPHAIKAHAAAQAAAHEQNTTSPAPSNKPASAASPEQLATMTLKHKTVLRA